MDGLMSGKFKPRCPRCEERTLTRFRVDVSAYLCDPCFAAVLAGAPRVLADETPVPEFPVSASPLKQWPRT